MIDSQIEKVTHAAFKLNEVPKPGMVIMVLAVLCNAVLEILIHLKQNGMD